jgi:hypothetical protein
VPDSTPLPDAALRERIVLLEKENALLREKIDALARRLFGVKSEKLDSAQLLLLLQGLDGPKKVPEPVGAEAPRRSQVPSPSRSRGSADSGSSAAC